MSAELTNTVTATQNDLRGSVFGATILKQAISADGNSSAIDFLGGGGWFTAQGDFGGGTVTLQFSNDGGTTYSAIDSLTTLTADGGSVFDLPPCKLRINTAGSTSPNLIAWVEKK